MYAELAVTTNFSFLRGASHAQELVVCAKRLGLAGIGIADRNSVAGVVRAHMAAEEAGLPDPLRVSFRGALEELANMRPILLFATPRRAEVLLRRLRTQIATHLVPERPGRHFPRPRDGKPKNKGNGRHQPSSKRDRKAA